MTRFTIFFVDATGTRGTAIVRADDAACALGMMLDGHEGDLDDGVAFLIVREPLGAAAIRYAQFLRAGAEPGGQR